MLLILFGKHQVQRTGKFRGRADFVIAHHRAGAVRIVEIENSRLHEDARSAEARGMQRIAFDFHRPPLPALHQRTRAKTAERHRRGKNQRLA